MYFRLPLATSTPASRPNSSHSSRYPLSSPTTTPPSVCTHNSSAIRRESNSSISDAKSARALLSRVASSPIVTPVKGSHHHHHDGGHCSHPSSPLSTHEHHHEQDATSPQRPGGVVGAMERRWSDGYEAARGWTGHEQREGYISFPDYEKYFPANEVVPTTAYADHAAAPNAQRREIQA